MLFKHQERLCDKCKLPPPISSIWFKQLTTSKNLLYVCLVCVLVRVLWEADVKLGLNVQGFHGGKCLVRESGTRTREAGWVIKLLAVLVWPQPRRDSGLVGWKHFIKLYVPGSPGAKVIVFLECACITVPVMLGHYGNSHRSSWGFQSTEAEFFQKFLPKFFHKKKIFLCH